jgi:hypothetical protein
MTFADMATHDLTIVSIPYKEKSIDIKAGKVREASSLYDRQQIKMLSFVHVPEHIQTILTTGPFVK